MATDPEFEALNATVEHMEKLDEKARARVLRYLNDRYKGNGGVTGPPVSNLR